MAAGKIEITVQTIVQRVYEVDLDKLVADEYFEDVDVSSHEALGDRLDEWLAHEPDEWKADWARELAHKLYAERDVYEIDYAAAVREEGDEHAS